MSTYHAVLFDLDGVLLNSEPYWQDYWQNTIFPNALSGEPTLEDVTGKNFRESVAELDTVYGLPDSKAAVVERIANDAEAIYREKAELTFQTEKLFRDLQEKGIRIGIVSSSPEKWIRLAISEYDVEFDTIVSAEEIDGPGKPDPEIYEQGARNLDISPRECIVIEDSTSGIEAAAAAGATVIRFKSSEQATDHPLVDAVAADREVLEKLIFEYLSQ